jgi:hypothetical protein
LLREARNKMPFLRSSCLVFHSRTGKVLVWLEVEIEDGFELGEERALKASEGELLVLSERAEQNQIRSKPSRRVSVGTMP